MSRDQSIFDILQKSFSLSGEQLKARSNQVQILSNPLKVLVKNGVWGRIQGREDSKVYLKHFKSTKSIGRILNLQGCKLACLAGNPNEHFDKSYDTDRFPEVDDVEYSNKVC